MPHDPRVTPIMRGRLVLVAERYGTPRALVPAASDLSATQLAPKQPGPDPLVILLE
jgi:hypothetical protein